MTLPAHLRLQRRGSRYFLRAKVPEALRQGVGKQEILKALSTSVYAEALDRVRVASVEVDALFSRKRRELTARAETKPMEAELFQAVLAWFHRQERAVNDRFRPPEDEHDRESWLEALDGDESSLTGPEGEYSVQAAADAVLAAHGLVVEVGSRDRWRVVGWTNRALVELVRRDRARFQGRIDEPAFDRVLKDVSASGPPPEPPRPRPTLQELMELYATRRSAPASRIRPGAATS